MLESIWMIAAYNAVSRDSYMLVNTHCLATIHTYKGPNEFPLLFAVFRCRATLQKVVMWNIFVKFFP